MPASPALRAVLWVVALAAAVGLSILLAGPVTLAIRGLGIDANAEMGHTFRRVLLVAVLGVVLVGLHPWRDRPPGLWGLYGGAAKPLQALTGIGLAFGLLTLLAAWQAIPGWITWDREHGASKFASRWPAAIARGVILGVGEEVFFRGWLLARLRRKFAPLAAAAFAAACFAIPHLFKASASPKGLSADPAGALQALDSWFGNALDFSAAPMMVGVFVFGMLLAAAFYRTKSLWLGIGIHGGAIFYFDAMSALTERSPERNWAGSKWIYDGVPAYVVMAAVAYALWPRAPKSPAGSPP